MARHYNPSIVIRALRTFGFKSGDMLSDEVAGPVATIPLKPRIDIIKSATSASTVFTTASDKDTYITNVALSASKTTADTGTAVSITCVVDGATVTLIRFISATLTAFEQSGQEVYFEQLRVDRNTAVTLSVGGTWTGVCCQIKGYTEQVMSS